MTLNTGHGGNIIYVVDVLVMTDGWVYILYIVRTDYYLGDAKYPPAGPLCLGCVSKPPSAAVDTRWIILSVHLCRSMLCE